ncbi:UNVERIFIED_CONTAM: hypothetical protein H355_004776 [Colinus virginianus]|nr:hypothetical protein H355_004776 [Colinus virginianus]
MVLPLWSDTQVFLDGDGGFSVTSGGQTRIFKPISIQTMWADRCTLGMVLPLWSDTQVFLDGDGGFSVTSGGQTRIFKPISIQTMW